MCPLLAKNTQILDENGHFHKTSLLTRTSTNQHGHKNASFLKKKCTLIAEGPNLACREPNLACQVCQARLSSFSGQEAPNSTEHPVFGRILEVGCRRTKETSGWTSLMRVSRPNRACACAGVCPTTGGNVSTLGATNVPKLKVRSGCRV